MSDIREDLERSFAAAESAEQNDTQGTLQADSAQNADDKGQPALEGQPATDGQSSLEGQPATDGQVPVDGAGKTPVAAKPASLTDTPPVTSQRIKPPASWKPDIREHWDKVPPQVQAEVQRREREIATALQESAGIRDFAQEFHRIAAPYQHIIALEGDDPITSFGNYLRTASILRVGSPAEKANAVAQAIKQYAVDVQLLDGALASVLSGAPMPQGQPGQGPQQFVDPRVDQLLATIQESQRAQEAAMAQGLVGELEAFAADEKNEFFQDVRVDMGEILALATRNGRRMTLQEAYDRATKLHPEVSKIVAQREAAVKARAAQEAANKRRKAGSSITGQAPQQGNAQDTGTSSRREDIEAAFQALEG